MKLINLPHKVCGMTCMVNGLEDLYEQQTGIRLPDWFLFYASGMAGFAYIKVKVAPVPRFVGWGTVVQRQYALLSEVVGFTWTMSEGGAFKSAFQGAKAQVDAGTPVILGALDMYHLPYYTAFYHRVHIPIHYVLMVGYDDARGEALVQDCDRAEVQAIPYSDLQAAWNVHVPGLSKKNTWFAFTFNESVADLLTIARRALAHKANFMLHPPVNMFGIAGMRKLARELPAWPDELDSDKLDICLRSLAEYTGQPPMLPPCLLGDPDAPNDHSGGRAGYARVLDDLARTYAEPVWGEAARLFEQSGQRLAVFTDRIVDVILGVNPDLGAAAALVLEVADLEERAYTRIAAAEQQALEPA